MTIIQRIILVISAVIIFLITTDIKGSGLTPNEFRYYRTLIGIMLLITGLLYLAFNKKRGKEK